MTSKNRKAALHNLGCKVNSYETEAMAQNLTENGYEIVDFKPGADVYVINTCTVTNIADRKSRQMLHKAKRMNKDAVVVAVGCYVQAAGETLEKDDAIDILLGNNKKNQLVQSLNEYFDKKENEKDEYSIDKKNKINVYEDLSEACEYENMLMTTVTEHTRAFIKIQDGCNQFCTYCIIPYSRGRIRSRKLDDIIIEVNELAKKGYKEIVLTGIHLSSYGKDFKDENITLLTVVEALNEIEGIKRIRLGSFEQGIITEEFIEKISSINKFCPHFHLSLQSGCRETLKRMNRHYTPEEYLKKCELIRKYFVKPALTTDVIVGFPGETIEEFEITMKFLEKVQFAEMHIFKYSKRKGTIAEKMEHQVDDKIKSTRSDMLIELDEILKKKYQESFIGEVIEVLFEEKISIDGEDYFVGYTKEYLKIAMKSEKDINNTLMYVKIKSLLNKEILLAQL